MKPADIEKIANTVVGSLAATRDAGLTGCAGLSDLTHYEWGDEECITAPKFYCGGQGIFSCSSWFTGCPSDVEFYCEPVTGQFECKTGTGATYFPNYPY